MREETRKDKKEICFICRRPIEDWQRPSVLLKDGREIHIDCYNQLKDEDDVEKPPN